MSLLTRHTTWPRGLNSRLYGSHDHDRILGSISILIASRCCVLG